MGEERDFMATDKETGEQVQVIKIVADDVALQLSRIESIVFQPSRAKEEVPA
jgi:single-strand DNA-binding protein